MKLFNDFIGSIGELHCYDGACTPSRIAYHIIDGGFDNAKIYTYIICGKNGPTGKTWLRRLLIDFGYNAFEISESTCGLIQYCDDENHLIVNNIEKTVIIILNKSLREMST